MSRDIKCFEWAELSAVSIDRECLVGRRDLCDSGAAADGFQSGFRLGSNPFPRCGHERAFTYNYVKSHPKHAALHDLSATQSEAARSECVVHVKAASEANLQATNYLRHDSNTLQNGTQYQTHNSSFITHNSGENIIGRFLSPDPYIQAPCFAQNFDRYSYVWNNPLKYVDPSGYKVGGNGPGFAHWWYIQMLKIKRATYEIWDDPFDDPLSSGGDFYDYGTSGGGGGGGAPLGGSAASGPGSGGGGGGAAPLNLGGDGGPGNSGKNRTTTTAGAPLNRPKPKYNGGCKNGTNALGVSNDQLMLASWLGVIGDAAHDIQGLKFPNTLMKGFGLGAEVLSNYNSINATINNPSSGNISRAQTTFGFTLMTFIPEVGPSLGFVGTAIYNAGAFNWYYDCLDALEKETGCRIIIGLYPYPILIPKR